MLSIDQNPPTRWPATGALGECVEATGLAGALGDIGPRGDTRWWVGHTKARFEKAFAFDLLARRVPYFLPMVERVRVSGGRKRRGLMPLFPGYVFFRGGREDRYRALATDRLCQVIEVADQARLAAELAALDQALAAGVSLDPYPFAAVGRRCRVACGPLEGIEGTVVRRDGTTRLVLEVAMLGQAAAVEIDAGLLEPAGPEPARAEMPRSAGSLARSA